MAACLNGGLYCSLLGEKRVKVPEGTGTGEFMRWKIFLGTEVHYQNHCVRKENGIVYSKCTTNHYDCWWK